MALMQKLVGAGAGAVGSMVGGPAGGAVAGKAASSAMDKLGKLRPNKTQKEMLQQDLNTLQNDPDALGLSDAERQQIVGDATQQAGQLAQAQTSELARSALAGTPQQQSALNEAASSLTGASAQAGAEASRTASDLHQSMVQQEKARIMSDLDRRAAAERENRKFWLQFGIDSLATLMGAAGAGGRSGTGDTPSPKENAFAGPMEAVEEG